MYQSHFEIVTNQISDDLEIRVSQQDDSIVMTEVKLKKGTVLPEHAHLSDHSGYLLSGKLRIRIDQKSVDFNKGESWCIPKNICHYTEALENSVFLDAFNPITEVLPSFDFIDKAAK